MPVQKIGNKTFVVDNDIIDVTPLAIIDNDWEFTDKSNHLHRWQNDRLPSLIQIIDSPSTEEYPAYSHFVCRQCGETIIPRYKTPEYREWSIINKHYLIDNIEVTKEQFESEHQTSLQNIK